MQQIEGPIGVFDSGYGGLTILRKLQEACPLWVPIVETGESDSPGTDFFVRKHLERLLAKDEKIDTIILGCTHYPILMPKIQRLLTPSIKVVAQGELVAKSLEEYLVRDGGSAHTWRHDTLLHDGANGALLTHGIYIL